MSSPTDICSGVGPDLLRLVCRSNRFLKGAEEIQVEEQGYAELVLADLAIIGRSMYKPCLCLLQYVGPLSCHDSDLFPSWAFVWDCDTYMSQKAM